MEDFENIQDTWEVIKDRPLGEYLNFLNDVVADNKRHKDVEELKQNAMIYAAASLGAYYFAKHIGEEDAED